MTAETMDSAGVRRKVDEFVSGVKEQAQRLRTKSFDDLMTDTREFVKENPGKTILVSLAVGVVIGSLLRRR